MASTRRTEIWLLVLLVTLLLLAQAALLLTAGVDPSEIRTAQALDSTRSDPSAAVVRPDQSPRRPFSVDNPSTKPAKPDPEALAMLQTMYDHYLKVDGDRTEWPPHHPRTMLLTSSLGIAGNSEPRIAETAQWIHDNQPILENIDRLPETRAYWTPEHPWSNDVSFKLHLTGLANSRMIDILGSKDTRQAAIQMTSLIPIAETLGPEYCVQLGWFISESIDCNYFIFAPMDWHGLDWSGVISAASPPDFTAFADTIDERAAAVQRKILEMTQTPIDRLLLIFGDNSSLQPMRLAFRANQIYADINKWRASTHDSLSRMQSITELPEVWREFPIELGKVPGFPPSPNQTDVSHTAYTAVQMVLLDAALGLLAGDPVSSENVLVRENALTHKWGCRVRLDVIYLSAGDPAFCAYRLIFESEDGAPLVFLGSRAQFRFEIRAPLPQVNALPASRTPDVRASRPAFPAMPLNEEYSPGAN